MNAANARYALRNLYQRTPHGFQRAILVQRRERAWRRAGMVFIHVPKAAGSSISDVLYGRFMGHARATDVRRWGSRSVNALPSFAVTRNPWDRLVSAYRFARRGAGVGGAIQVPISWPERYQIPEFDTFERFVTDWLAKRDSTRLDGVFQPQSLFVCDQLGRVIVDHVGRVEDLRPTLEFLSDRLGVKPAIGHSNRSGEIVDYRDYYTPELIDLVGRIYADDIRRFGYRFEE